jgi:thiol-disulfide isomerase/thioredoxin
MRFRRVLLAVLPLGLLLAAETPRSADALLDEAKAQAKDGRAIFAVFGASWCGWCKRLDKFLESPEFKPIVSKYFVVAHFTVEESKGKEALNTPGGDELVKRLGGPAGLPFYAFLDDKGGMIVNSILDPSSKVKGAGGNIGHPAQPQEIDWFLTMLSRGAPRMTTEERAVADKYLRSQPK